MLDRSVGSAALGAIWDPIAAAACADAGVGATLKLRIGGKSGPASAAPLDVVATVKAVREAYDQAGARQFARSDGAVGVDRGRRGGRGVELHPHPGLRAGRLPPASASILR